MSTRTVLKIDCPTIEDVERWLFEETGGQCVVDGKIKDAGDSWVIPVFSADGRGIPRTEAGPGRCIYRVLSDGICTDDYGEFSFPKSLGFKIGFLFSAKIAQGPTLTLAHDIFLEAAPDEYGRIVPVKYEREEFESAGPERGGWTPPAGAKPNDGLNGGHPDTGRFSHPD